MNAHTEILPQAGLAAYSFEASDDIIEFAKAFAKAQAAMGDVLKGSDNAHFKTKYADLGAVVEATLPALNGAGFSVLQPPSFDGETVRVSTLILHESGQWMRSTLALRPSKTDPHGVGSAITYARRYGLLAMCGVAPEDDDGNAASGPVQTQHDTRQASRQEDTKQKPDPQAVIDSAKGGIDMCGDEVAIDRWLAEKAENLRRLKQDMPVAHDMIIAHARSRQDEMREAAAARVRSKSDAFNISDDEIPF